MVNFVSAMEKYGSRPVGLTGLWTRSQTHLRPTFKRSGTSEGSPRGDRARNPGHRVGGSGSTADGEENSCKSCAVLNGAVFMADPEGSAAQIGDGTIQTETECRMTGLDGFEVVEPNEFPATKSIQQSLQPATLIIFLRSLKDGMGIFSFFIKYYPATRVLQFDSQTWILNSSQVITQSFQEIDAMLMAKRKQPPGCAMQWEGYRKCLLDIINRPS
ncbi:hypothetical protein C8J56DRAFT_899514 [Mycena floridula]|nr:hypothetical protein C8J56DRAFT_899514 [Mycena floridula]